MGRVLRALILVGLAVTFFALALVVLADVGAQEEEEEEVRRGRAW